MKSTIMISWIFVGVIWSPLSFAQNSNVSLIDQLNAKTEVAQERQMEQRGRAVRRWCGENLECFNPSPNYDYSSSSDSYSDTSSTSSSRQKPSSGKSTPERGVRSIQSNGKIGGHPSSAITCLTGSRHIVYRKNGTWYTGGGGHMGNKFNSLSVQGIAEHKCK